MLTLWHQIMFFPLKINLAVPKILCSFPMYFTSYYAWQMTAYEVTQPNAVF